jgi:hypothetical protein
MVEKKVTICFYATVLVMLAEYFVNPAGGPVGAVHFVVCEKSGDWVFVDFQNNTHEDFQRIAPKSIEDCDRLAMNALRNGSSKLKICRMLEKKYH